MAFTDNCAAVPNHWLPVSANAVYRPVAHSNCGMILREDSIHELPISRFIVTNPAALRKTSIPTLVQIDDYMTGGVLNTGQLLLARRE